MRKFLSVLFLFLLSGYATAETYEVGPDESFANIGDIPWENLVAGDLVLIHWREQPYREKWVVAAEGTQSNPVVVRGVAGPQGQLPVIDGQNATTRSEINFWNEERGIVKVGGSNIPSVETPAWIVIENLDIRNGRPPHQFTGRNGRSSYNNNAASMYIEIGENITIRNCILQNSGNGLFVSAASRNITIEGCSIFDNGIENSIYQHNTYTAAIGMIYQYNYFGPLRNNCLGNNLKDRSAGTVVRYNWIESGNRQLDLVDAEDSSVLANHPSYRSTFVYGNVLVEPDGAGNRQIIHYGGDSGTISGYRKGTLYLYNNTVISTRSGNTTLLRLSTNDETCDARNNIVYVTAPGNHLAMLNSAGVLDLRNNWFKSEWRDSHGSLSGTINDLGDNVLGSDPGFVSFPESDYHLSQQSNCVDKGTTLHRDASSAHPMLYQFIKPRGRETRPSDGTFDIGAYEYGSSTTTIPSRPMNLLIVR